MNCSQHSECPHLSTAKFPHCEMYARTNVLTDVFKCQLKDETSETV
jgi:hypothetical protein